MILTIELVPKTAWYKNVRSEMSQEQWDYIRKNCYRKAGYKCEICSGKGDKWPVECHEIWEYDDTKKKQTLKGMIALCPDCHKVKHAGLSQMKGEINLVIKQLMKVNNVSKDEAIAYIDKAFGVWKERSRHSWKTDISLITTV